jgi:hypothetical protein
MELIKFCFKDEDSGVGTIIVLGIIFWGIVSIIKAIKGTDD